MITVEERAAEVYEVVRGCTLCPLSATRTNAVPGEGPLDAEVMCIGEAPGVNEDKQGRPFVGAAGQFLGELLAAAGLTREQVYICNVLKCRPPGNRDPLPGEIEACADYLDLQLDMVDPLVVITLGRFSMSRWFPQQAISRIHGSVKEVDGRLVIPMYHPAAALHQGNLRQVLLDDFARVPQVLERARARRAAPKPPATRVAAPTPPAGANSADRPPVKESAAVTAPQMESAARDTTPPPEPSAEASPARAEFAEAPAGDFPNPLIPEATPSGPAGPDPADKTEQIRLFD